MSQGVAVMHPCAGTRLGKILQSHYTIILGIIINFSVAYAGISFFLVVISSISIDDSCVLSSHIFQVCINFADTIVRSPQDKWDDTEG